MTRQQLAQVARTRASLADGSARAARLASGVSVAEVASVLGLSPQAVSQWEGGKRRPTAVNALAYARALAAVAATQ